MSSRRSGRSKSKIDYSKFGGDDDFDDDFADMTPPPSKKSKITSDNKENNSKKKVSVTVHEKKKKERPSVDEKIYERELQAALELSISESQSSSCEVTDEVTKNDNCSTEETSSIPLNTAEITNGQSDEIVILDEEPKTTQRAAAVKKSKNNVIVDDDEESDFDAFSEDSGDEDDDYEESSDFEGYKNKQGKGKTKEKTKKSTLSKVKHKSPVKLKQKSPVAAKPKTPVAQNRKSSTATSSVKTSHTVRSPSYNNSTGGSDQRKWVPPGITSSAGVKSPLGGISITSPSSGLRLGLSRNQKLKPLHPTLKIQQ